jgi:rubrerythrin
MAKTDSQPKDHILREFETMKSFELSARDLYTRIAASPKVEVQKVKTAFASMAADEQRHADLVQEIIDLLHHAL